MSSTTLSTHLYAPRTDLWDWQLRATCRQVETDLFFPRKAKPITIDGAASGQPNGSAAPARCSPNAAPTP